MSERKKKQIIIVKQFKTIAMGILVKTGVFVFVFGDNREWDFEGVCGGGWEGQLGERKR